MGSHTAPTTRQFFSSITRMSDTSSSEVVSVAADGFAAPVNTQFRMGKHEETKGDILPWVEKYRPATLDELISHEEIVNTVSRLIDSNQLPHLLFYGPPGTGKTSAIHAIARKINGPNYHHMILELNASDDRGIDVVREEIVGYVSSCSFFSAGLKLVVLDEADALTHEAQFALRQVIEKHTKSTRFFLLCNYISKIIPALQSRCMRFRFKPLEAGHVRERLQFVVGRENCNVTPDGLNAIIKLANGDMRCSLNILQSCHMTYDQINETNVYSCTGNPLPSDIKLILDMLTNLPLKQAYEGILGIQTLKGLSLKDILTYLHELMILEISYSPPVLNFLLAQMGNIEYRLSHGTNETLQLASLVGVFKQAHQMTEEQPADKEKRSV